MRRIEFIGPALLVAVAALLLLIGAPMAYRGYSAARSAAEVQEASQRLLDNPVLEQMSQASRDVARVVEPSVVHVSTAGMARGRGGSRSFSSSGSGWIWDSEGHVVTNAHVVDGANSIEVQLYDGRRREATLVGLELRADVAVLKIAAGGLSPAQRSMEEPRQGELVFAFGSPFDFRFSMSTGIISGVGRTAGLADLDYENFIQVDAAINPGNSGGPLTDIMGRVIGMNTAIATGRGGTLGQGQSAGIGLAIPMEMIESIVSQIIISGRAERAYLGISVTALSELRPRPETRDADADADAVLRGYQGDGAVITTVGPGSPAAEAGLKPGDVIISIGGSRISSRKQVFAVVGTQRPGARVRIEYWRPNASGGGGERRSTEAVLVSSDPTVSYAPLVQLVQAVGIKELSNATPERCASLGVPFRRGVMIESLDPRSPAGEALVEGTIITEVEGQAIGSLDDFYMRLARAGDSTSVLRSNRVTLTVVAPDGVSGVFSVPVRGR